MRGLTDRQLRALVTICTLCQVERVAPTFDTVADAIGTSKNSVRRLIMQLGERKALELGPPHSKRTMWPTPHGWAMAGISPPEDPRAGDLRRIALLERQVEQLTIENQGLKARLDRLIPAPQPALEVA